MIKILSQERFETLSAQAEKFEQLIKKIAEAGADTSVSADDIMQYLASNEKLQEELNTATARIAELEEQLSTATTRIAELEEEPAEPTASSTATVEPTAQEETLADFANKHAGDYASIVAEMKSRGII